MIDMERWIDFAKRDDCLNRMNPSELRLILKQTADLMAENKRLRDAQEDGQTITDEIKDGRLLLLEVEGGEEAHPTQDAKTFITIGFNTLKDTGEDFWHIAGWCWSHDHFVETKGTPLKWRSLPSPQSDKETGK